MHRPLSTQTLPVLGLLLILLLPLPPAEAAILHVPADFPNIQSAVDAAVDGDEVRVSPGIYTGSGNKDIDFRGKDLDVIGEGGPTVTILDLEDSGRGFDFHSGEPYTASVEGFTIRNGDVEGLGEQGGGIRCVGASVAFRHCVIEDCRASGGAGGLLLVPVVQTEVIDCVLRRNLAARAGGAGGEGAGAIVHGPLVLRDCWIEDNTAEEVVSGPARGGGVSCHDGAVLDHCRVTGNVATRGWGGGVFGTDFSLVSCEVVGNSAATGGGIASTGVARLEECLVTGNVARAAGGGLAALLGADINVVETTISSNLAESDYGTLIGGGGILCYENRQVRVYASILWGNCADEGGAEAQVYPGGQLGLQCSDWRRDGVAGGGLLIWTSDVIEEDPLFCDPSDCAQAPNTTGGYELQLDSPCLPTGNSCGRRMGARDGGCGATPVVLTSWGGLKTHFR